MSHDLGLFGESKAIMAAVAETMRALRGAVGIRPGLCGLSSRGIFAEGMGETVSRGGHAAVTLAFLLLVAVTAARGEEVAQPVPLDAQCSVPPDEHWTDAEKFVWSRVCVGAVADFNEGTAYGGDLDPRKPEGLPESRVIRSGFLETILLEDKYRQALTRRGVRIAGARFKEELELENAHLGYELRLERSLLEQGAFLPDVITTEGIDLNGSKIAGTLYMQRLRAAKTVAMKDGTDIATIDLRGAHIGGDLLLSSSTVHGALELDDIEVDRNLLMENARLPGVQLRAAHVGGDLDLSGSTMTGPASMTGLEVGKNLLFGGWNADGTHLVGGDFSCAPPSSHAKADPGGNVSFDASDDNASPDASAQPTCIDLSSARVAGSLALQGSTVRGQVFADTLRVEGTAYLGDGAEFRGGVTIHGSKIGALNALAAKFDDYLDLTGTAIAGEFLLGAPEREPTQWGSGSILVLRNAFADAIQDSAAAWPGRLDLTGFTYRNLGSWSVMDNGSLGDRGVASLEAWLGNQARYTPQPYEELASVLRLQGRADDADEILYAGRERDRLETASFWHGVKATALKLIIGYGYHLWWSVYWFIALWAIGAFVQWTRVGARVRDLDDVRALRRLATEMPGFFVYSFEMLLPVVRFRGQTRDFPFGWQDVYFHIHGLVGLALTAFLGAGLAGLTK